MSDSRSQTFRVMSYNVHGCLGTDGVRDVRRIADVINLYEPDIVGLQEVDVRCHPDNSEDQARILGEQTHRAFCFTAARANERGEFGNLVLTRHPFEFVAEGALPVRFGETRTAQRLRIFINDAPAVEFVNTHLSIHLIERMMQVRALISETEPEVVLEKNFAPVRCPSETLVLCGDLNAGSWSPIYRWFLRHLHDAQRQGGSRALATWPARFPLLRLDHVWVGSRLKSTHVMVPRTPLTRKASDHLPLIVDLRVEADAAQGDVNWETFP